MDSNSLPPFEPVISDRQFQNQQEAGLPDSSDLSANSKCLLSLLAQQNQNSYPNNVSKLRLKRLDRAGRRYRTK